MPLLGSRGAASTTGFGALANLGYFLRNSLRFRSSASAYLSRTLLASNRKTFTFNVWVKKSVVGSSTYAALFSSTDNLTSTGWLHFNVGNYGSADTLTFEDQASGTVLVTTQVFCDPSAWYMITLSIDTTQATSSNRAKLYVNGTQITAFSTSTYPSQNADTNFNRTTSFIHTIGSYYTNNAFFDGYLAEVNFIDGQALTPSSFGKTDAVTNQWVPKKFGGTYGTNGFYLPFTNTTSTSTLGNDFSGNSNTWTVNNISLTSGTTYDSMTDVPTLTNATTANYCTWNSLAKGSNLVTTSGNLSVNNGGVEANHRAIVGTMGMTTGKWYWEAVVNNSSNVDIIGVIPSSISTFNNYVGGLGDSAGWGYNTSTGNYYVGGNWASSGTAPAFTSSATIMIAYDADAKKMWVGQNGTWNTAAGGVGNPSSGTNALFTYSGSETTFLPAVSIYNNTGAWVANFGQRPFTYTPPSGFKALNSFNLP